MKFEEVKQACLEIEENMGSLLPGVGGAEPSKVNNLIRSVRKLARIIPLIYPAVCAKDVKAWYDLWSREIRSKYDELDQRIRMAYGEIQNLRDTIQQLNLGLEKRITISKKHEEWLEKHDGWAENRACDISKLFARVAILEDVTSGFRPPPGPNRPLIDPGLTYTFELVGGKTRTIECVHTFSTKDGHVFAMFEPVEE